MSGIDKLHRLVYQAASLACVLTTAYGEFDEDERGGDQRAAVCMNHLAGLLSRAMDTVLALGHEADEIHVEAIRELEWAHATANLLNDLMETSLSGTLMSDEIMCNLCSMLQDCLWRSHAWLFTPDADDKDLFALEKLTPFQPSTSLANDVPAQKREKPTARRARKAVAA